MLRAKQNSPTKFDIRNQLEELLIKIHLMKSYATEQGTPILPETARQIAQLGSITAPHPSDEGKGSGNAGDSLPWMDSTSVGSALEMAFSVHAKLAELVKPATPESIEASQPRQGWTKLSSPRVSDILILITIVGIVLFFWSAMLASKTSNATQITGAALQFSYLGAALLGASFSGLYTAYKYISTRTFDPLYTSSYVTRVLLGLVAGLILANFGASFSASSSTNVKILAPAALGLIGGYSADAVNLLLQRIADTLVAAVRGSGDETMKDKQAQLRAESKAADMKTVGELSELLARTTDPELKASIQRLMSALGKSKDVTGAVTGKTT
jgi:hypothetical protein